MHLLTLFDQIVLGPKDTIDPGEIVTDDVTAAHMLVIAGRGKMQPLAEERPFDETKDWNDKSILFMRAGGFGDLMLLTPVLRELHWRWPDIKIGVSTMGHYGVVLEELPFVDELVPYPCRKEQADKCDAWVWLENAIERNPLAQKLHMTDLFAKLTGLSGDFDKLPDYRVRETETVWANEGFPRLDSKRRLVVQIGTSALCRTYPRDQMGVVLAALMKKGWEVFIVGGRDRNGRPEVVTDPRPNLHNLCGNDLTFRQSCAVASTASCILGSDSAFVHLAGALKIPAVALYGPFPWELRTKYCPTTVALSGNLPCAPCFHHMNSAKQNHFPDNCPTREQGICGALAEIKPERIVAKIEAVARTPELKLVEPEKTTEVPPVGNDA